MLKEAIEKIICLAGPNYHELGSPDKLMFTDKALNVIAPPAYPTIKATTLEALRQFVEYDLDGVADTSFRLIHIVSPDVVRYVGQARPDGGRNVFFESKLDLGINFQFGQFYQLQDFIIALQTCFIPSEQLSTMLEFLSSIVVGENGQFTDNGIYQNITVKSGITAIENKQVTPRVSLKPLRTFTDIDQPESVFLFRMKATSEAKAIACAIFNCDGNAWRPVAMSRIAEWVRKNVAIKVTVLA